MSEAPMLRFSLYVTIFGWRRISFYSPVAGNDRIRRLFLKSVRDGDTGYSVRVVVFDGIYVSIRVRLLGQEV